MKTYKVTHLSTGKISFQQAENNYIALQQAKKALDIFEVSRNFKVQKAK